MKPIIKRYKDSLFPEYHWVVMTDNGWDLCRTLGRAIRYWLWHCGVPAKIAFWGSKKKVNMTEKEALKILVEYNLWRRGAEMPQPHPFVIGQAIDVAIECLTKSVQKDED